MRAVINLDKGKFEWELNELERKNLRRAAAICDALRRCEDDEESGKKLKCTEETLLHYAAAGDG